MPAMAMGKRGDEQEDLFVTHQQLRAASHPYYRAVNKVLGDKGFDRYAEGLCAKFYARKVGRPGLAPGVYFRCLLLGYFEGIDSERGIAWRAADSLSLRDFLGVPASKLTPDHSTISRTRRLIDVETHHAVFTWVLGVLDSAGLIKGKTIGVDATTLEANAAMRSIVRRDDGRSYEEFLTDLANASGIATPTREDLARVDRKRKKKGSNKDWFNPYDPDAKITKMKDGRTHLAHKQEHAVDMDTGAVVAVTLQGATEGDTATLEGTLGAAQQNLDEAREKAGDESKRTHEPKEVVADKGYHSKSVMLSLQLAGWRSYVAEPRRGRQRWEDQRQSASRVHESPAQERGPRPAADAPSRRADRADLRPCPRDRRDASDAPPVSREHRQACAHPHRGLQPGPPDAQVLRCGQAEVPPGRRGRPLGRIPRPPRRPHVDPVVPAKGLARNRPPLWHPPGRLAIQPAPGGEPSTTGC
jgi:Transposase and inactivated derivatives